MLDWGGGGGWGEADYSLMVEGFLRLSKMSADSGPAGSQEIRYSRQQALEHLM